MADWLGHLLAHAPFWVVILVGGIVAIVAGLFYLMPYGFETKGPKSEWQKSWYKKKEVKHGKK